MNDTIPEHSSGQQSSSREPRSLSEQSSSGEPISDAVRSTDELGKFRVTLYDSVTSFLTALMLMIGTIVSILFLLWLIDSQPAAESFPPPSISRVSTYHPPGLERDFQVPGVREVEKLQEISIADALEAVTDAASRVAGSPIAAESETFVNSLGENGVGDSRPPGPINSDVGVPAFDRWQLKFRARNLRSYASQLDHFGIELGAIGGGIAGVDYATDLTSGRPGKRHGESGAESRLYFLWNASGPLLGYDRQLLASSGVEIGGRQVIKFVSPGLEKRLTELELEYARAHGRQSIAEIAKTVFESEPTAGGFRFRVVAQRYRKTTAMTQVQLPAALTGHPETLPYRGVALSNRVAVIPFAAANPFSVSFEGLDP